MQKKEKEKEKVETMLLNLRKSLDKLPRIGVAKYSQYYGDEDGFISYREVLNRVNEILINYKGETNDE